ncbi:MAG: CRTAC1 family protein [Candidatus Thiodiazotropha sp. (ex Dulcina madagascariensis)]|nr:CRTAC1 family protein [Candidatus Thiodiazotropha sp. (ex Dulcina madagascariensis)]
MIFKVSKGIVVILLLTFGCLSIAEIKFSDVTDQAGLNHSGDSWGIAWGDFNNDGWPDLYDTNHRERPAFFISQGDGTFRNQFDKIFAHNEVPDYSDTHGAQWADIDNDGYSDLIVSAGGNGGGLTKAYNNTQLLMNDGGRRLDQRAEALGLANPEYRGRTPLATDYDKDGLLDILFTNITYSSNTWPERGTRLYRQFPRMVFQDTTNSAGLATSNSMQFAMVADLDGDDIDELIYPMKDSPIFNYMPPSFMDVSAKYHGLNIESFFDMAIGDFDGDLRPDIFRGGGQNNRTILEQLNAESLGFRFNWLNTRTPDWPEIGFTFRTTGPVTFEMDGGWVSINDYFIGTQGWTPPVIGSIAGPMVVHLNPADTANHGVYSYNFYDNAGNVFIGYEVEHDLWKVVFLHEDRAKQEKPTLFGKITSRSPITILNTIGNYATQSINPSRLFINTESGFKSYISAVGIDQSIPGGAHVATGDFDNDGDLDVYASNNTQIGNSPDFIYENEEGMFIQKLVGADSLLGVGRTVAVADYDLDGYLDVYLTHGAGNFPFNNGPRQLLRNVSSGNNWLQIDLEGISSNRDGIGARVRLEAGGIIQERYQNGGMHRFSQDMQRLHFGLGASTRADRIEVRWPSGIVQHVENIPANQIIRIQESRGTPESLRGQPDIYQLPGVYLWVDNYDGPYHVRIHGGAENEDYRVNLVSDRDVSNVTLRDAEPVDRLTAYLRGFKVKTTTSQWVDGIDFNLVPGARTLLAVEKHGEINPRMLFVGKKKRHLPPAGWILEEANIPMFSEYVRGESHGLTLGSIGTANSAEYRLRWTSKEFAHRYSLWLASPEPGVVINNMDLLEKGDRVSTSNNAISISGGILAPWEDGVDLTSNTGSMIALAFSLDGLFQRQAVNLFQVGGIRFPNAYWLEAPSPIGEPLDETGAPLIKIWKEQERSIWHVKFTGAISDEHVIYNGVIDSTGKLTLIDTQTLESDDNIDISEVDSIVFDISVYSDSHDEIAFRTEDDNALTFSLKSPDGLDRLRIGKEGWPVRELPVALQ